MADSANDDLEFTEEQLHAALDRVGRKARQEAFAAGLSVMVVRGQSLVKVHPDGTAVIVGAFCPRNGAGAN
jgi:hypothetical protein